MRKLRKNSFLAILVAICFVTTTTLAPCSVINAYGPVDVAAYEDWNFYGKSAPEPIDIYVPVDSVSLYATCAGITVDYLTCYIASMEDDIDFATTVDFPADGSVTTVPISMSPGQYKVYVVGNADIKKTDLLVVFTHFD